MTDAPQDPQAAPTSGPTEDGGSPRASQPSPAPKRSSDLPTVPRSERPDIEPAEDPGRQAVMDASEGKPVTPERTIDATEWLLGDDDSGIDYTRPLRINVGTEDAKLWMEWTIQPVDADQIKRIRKQSQTGTKAQRQRGQTELDDSLFAAKMVVEGTSYPNVRQSAGQKGLVAPEDIIRQRFVKKPGLVTQLSGAIMDLSGFDEDDVIDEVKAAGN